MDTLRRLLTNNTLLVASAIALLLAGFATSIAAETFSWLNRFGSLVICVGVVVLARPMILGEDIKTHVTMESGFSHLDPKHYESIGEQLPEYVIQDLKSRTAVGWLGPLIVFVGTFTNGFGDLLNKVMGYGA